MGFEGFFYRPRQGIGPARCLMVRDGEGKGRGGGGVCIPTQAHYCEGMTTINPIDCL